MTGTKGSAAGPRSKASTSSKRSESSILIVDDEFSVRDSLLHWFRKDGYRTEAASDADEALTRFAESRWDVVLLDIRMPGMDGMELLRRIRTIDPETVVVMITAYASVDTAVEALKDGAYDYITKPVDPDKLSHLVQRAVERRRLRTENVLLRRKVDELVTPMTIIGDSRPMLRVMELVRSVADTDATVLIRGESGSGKELIAQAIHANSRRRYHPIVPVNCGALPDSLLESELFGHEKGAFTGAQYRRKGKLEMADGGSLFLDEIGTIDLRTQVDLLRVIETKEFARLGGNRTVKVDFRVICATNQNLEQLVEQGAFREDLYFRIHVFTIQLPPLRDRREDIPLLARHFLERGAMQMNRPFRDFEPEALDALVQYRWPGNVRELANAVERALVVGTPPTIRLDDLPVRAGTGRDTATGDSLEAMQKAHIRKILDEQDWNITHSAEVLGIDRVTLYSKIKKYGLRG